MDLPDLVALDDPLESIGISAASHDNEELDDAAASSSSARVTVVESLQISSALAPLPATQQREQLEEIRAAVNAARANSRHSCTARPSAAGGGGGPAHSRGTIHKRHQKHAAVRGPRRRPAMRASTHEDGSRSADEDTL